MTASHFTTRLLAVGLIALATCPAWAQSSSDSTPEGPQTLTTKDGVKLHIEYFPSKAGRSATPVILLHDLKKSGRTLTQLARRLQEPRDGDTHQSFAVVAVDLRGHGDSKQQEFRGREREIDASKLSVQDTRAMVGFDLEAVRRFLVTENDAGRLNLNRTAMVGIGFGGLVAANYAAEDWRVPPLATVKQGQDVKALVLVSPPFKSKGLAMQDALRLPALQTNVSWLLLYGEQDRSYARDADRIYNQVARGRPEFRNSEPPESNKLIAELPELMKLGAKTKLQGTEWLELSGDKGAELIARFLDKHTRKDEYAHSRRRQN